MDGPGKRGGRLRGSLGGGHAPRYSQSGCWSEAALHSLGLAAEWKEPARLRVWEPSGHTGSCRPHTTLV